MGREKTFGAEYAILMKPLCERGLTVYEIADRLGMTAPTALVLMKRYFLHNSWKQKRKELRESKPPIMRESVKSIFPALKDAENRGYKVRIEFELGDCRFEGMGVYITQAEKLVQKGKYFLVKIPQVYRDRAIIVLYPNGNHSIELILSRKRPKNDSYCIPYSQMNSEPKLPSKKEIRKQKLLRKVLTGGGRYGTMHGLNLKRGENVPESSPRTLPRN